ncbi:DUF2306 domain-containing protein [Dactylosporangium aurantiacum]|uniref:DUF2306 domain-containing protein n=1 Tax=Dactylosporangium aurantiacum TaxID=35754 RepID=A0A9Q9IAQ9_9ACTN|nr:DUF2306 domain-containing protein [Dactylosporangium aurantiacum]MDG6105077.1 DUF2306 domain-containing protein [Dactylosporangium aurantiacum]UWZ51606.1 DUF2306 domain-containing protein [Dactylosporangium aurantiacum]
MSNNSVIGVLIPLHASGATIAMLLGAWNLRRNPKGDRPHRLVGRVWVVAMYWTVLSSFFIKELTPGHFSWIHGLSAFTFVTLSIGLWAALTHRVETHRRFMTGSYFGLLGAFAGAVAVPSRDIPQWLVHEPLGLAVAAAACLLVAAAVIAASRRRRAAKTPAPVEP